MKGVRFDLCSSQSIMNATDMDEEYALEAFTKDYVSKLLDNKFIIVIGDSSKFTYALFK